MLDLVRPVENLGLNVFVSGFPGRAMNPFNRDMLQGTVGNHPFVHSNEKALIFLQGV